MKIKQIELNFQGYDCPCSYISNIDLLEQIDFAFTDHP
jgi:hypothetical protein